MRTVLSLLFTFSGMAAVYLFACGALVGFSWDAEGVERCLERAVAPLVSTDFQSTLALALGMAAFAAGALIAPRADVWVALTRGDRNSVLDPALESRVLSYSRSVGRGKVLELALAVNGLIVAGLVAFLAMSALRPGPSRILGALYIVATLEVVVGVVMYVLWAIYGRRNAARRFRPVLAASAGLHLLELVFLLGVPVFGWL